jgi:hypothetical protein
MAPTIGDIVQRVREYMLDTESGAYRYSDRLIVGAIFDGMRTLHQMTPASSYQGLNYVEYEYPYVTDNTSDADLEEYKARPWHLDPRWEMAVRYFACARCFEIDGSDTLNLQRAQDCQANFTNLSKM